MNGSFKNSRAMAIREIRMLFEKCARLYVKPVKADSGIVGYHLDKLDAAIDFAHAFGLISLDEKLKYLNAKDLVEIEVYKNTGSELMAEALEEAYASLHR